MKIDLLITELHVGGAEKCLVALAGFLKSQSHAVRVISIMPAPNPAANQSDELIEQLKSNGIEVAFLDAESTWQSWNTAIQLRKLVERKTPDVAQSFLFHANVLAALVYPNYRVPVFGGTRVADPNRFRAWASRAASTRMVKVVCVSDSVALHCEHREGIPSERLVVIPNGIDFLSSSMVSIKDCSTSDATCASVSDARPSHVTEDALRSNHFAQKQLGLSPSTPILLFVGRMELQKGVDGLIANADTILNALPEHHLIMIGDGSMKSSLQSAASKSRSDARIHFVGRQSRVLDWMRSSQLLLLPSRYEGMPNVILEAMSVGLPVATTRAEGVVEALGQSADDQAVLIDAWSDWVAMVISIASDPAKAASLGRANAKRCREHFDRSQLLAKYESLYLETVAKLATRAPTSGSE